MARAEIYPGSSYDAKTWLLEKLASPEYRSLVTSPQGMAWLSDQGIQLEQMHESAMVDGLLFLVWVGYDNVALVALDGHSGEQMRKIVERVQNAEPGKGDDS